MCWYCIKCHNTINIYLKNNEINMKATNTEHPSKEFFSLTELLTQNLVPLKSRQLHFRFKNLIKQGLLVYGINLFKIGSSWQIHYSVIPYFEYQVVLKINQIPGNLCK